MKPDDFKRKIDSISTPLPGDISKEVFYKLPVKQKFEGKTILEFYSENQPQFPENYWLKKIISGNLTVNNLKIEPDFILKAGQITQHSALCEKEPFINTNIELIYEDEHILVLNKPAPLPVHACGRFLKNTLTNLISLAFPNETYKLVHRLDANTTGIVIFGKNLNSTQDLSKQFESNTIQKTYLALVEGIVKEDIFISKTTIGKEQKNSGSREIAETGNSAYTSFEVIKRNFESNNSLLLVKPKTGRTNQIRLHLASLKHPIVGDLGYKDPEYFKNNPMTYSEDTLFLHAWKLKLIHPILKTEIEFIAPIPEKFDNFHHL